MRKLTNILWSLPVCLMAAPVQAQDICEETVRPLDGQRLLRRTSLDLRGRVPSGAEIDAQGDTDTVSEAIVSSYLDSDAFVNVIRQHHEELLWPNIDQVELLPGNFELFPLPLNPEDPTDVVYGAPLRSVFQRTVGNGNIFTPCRNEPAEYDGEGNLVMEPVMNGAEIVAWTEGYELIEPYWAPGTLVKVCALDAQTADVGIVCPGPADRYPFAETTCQQFQGFANLAQAPFRGTEVSCSDATSLLAPACGCGENLNRCATPQTSAVIRASLLEQMMRIVEKTVDENRPYHEILTTKTIAFNGPAAHFMRHMTGLSFDTRTELDMQATPPELAYTQANTWVEIERTGRHAGVLTTPGYLLKFQSNRARAHRYHNAFACKSFIPNGPLPSPFEECSQRQDLTERCGCDACHIQLEPMAAHWGRFSEYGFLYMDEARYPTQAGANCTPPLSSINQLISCFRYYELDPQGEALPFRGMLNSYVFRDGDELANLSEGPTRLVQSSMDSGELAHCTVERMWSQLMRRTPTSDEQSVLNELQSDFVNNGYDIKSLVQAIVQQPAYARVP